MVTKKAYITSKVIAMGFPSGGMESMYRNPMGEVKRFLETKHKDHYKVKKKKKITLSNN